MMEIVMGLVVLAAVGFAIFMGVSLWRSSQRLKKLDAEYEASMEELTELLTAKIIELNDAVEDELERVSTQMLVEEAESEVKH